MLCAAPLPRMLPVMVRVAPACAPTRVSAVEPMITLPCQVLVPVLPRSAPKAPPFAPNPAMVTLLVLGVETPLPSSSEAPLFTTTAEVALPSAELLVMISAPVPPTVVVPV